MSGNLNCFIISGFNHSAYRISIDEPRIGGLFSRERHDERLLGVRNSHTVLPYRVYPYRNFRLAESRIGESTIGCPHRIQGVWVDVHDRSQKRKKGRCHVTAGKRKREIQFPNDRFDREIVFSSFFLFSSLFLFHCSVIAESTHCEPSRDKELFKILKCQSLHSILQPQSWASITVAASYSEIKTLNHPRDRTVIPPPPSSSITFLIFLFLFFPQGFLHIHRAGEENISDNVLNSYEAKKRRWKKLVTRNENYAFSAFAIRYWRIFYH